MSSDTTVVLDESKTQAFRFPVLILLLQSAMFFQPRDDQRRQNAPVLAPRAVWRFLKAEMMDAHQLTGGVENGRTG